jgi:hypothetical protein
MLLQDLHLALPVHLDLSLHFSLPVALNVLQALTLRLDPLSALLVYPEVLQHYLD